VAGIPNGHNLIPAQEAKLKKKIMVGDRITYKTLSAERKPFHTEIKQVPPMKSCLAKGE
jgi:tRNA U55 pseudouridine synthase TruB